MNSRPFRAALLAVLAALLPGLNTASGLVFKSDKVAAQWDTWCYHHNGTYYLYYLITETSPGEGFGVATSKDGVHWEDHGWALRASDKMVVFLGTGAVWKDPEFRKTGRFICNYSEYWKDEHGETTQNILFAWSTDLIHWNKFGDSHMFRVDERFYQRRGRWDSIFPVERPEGGYYGLWTATPYGQSRNGIGAGFSEDGVKWTALAAPAVEPKANEAGAVAVIGGKAYGMFGFNAKGLQMVTYVAPRVEGPYVVSTRNPVLLGTNDAYFARFLPTPQGLLVNHHSMSGGFHGKRDITYAAPLKRAIVDAEGVLRWKYWEGNEALKGPRVEVNLRQLSDRLALVAGDLDFTKGVVAEGPLEGLRAGLYLETDSQSYGLWIRPGGQIELGAVDASGRNWQGMKQAYRELSPRQPARFRLLARRGMLELYLDDDFFEAFAMRCPQAKRIRIGILGSGADKMAKDIRVWMMSL